MTLSEIRQAVESEFGTKVYSCVRTGEAKTTVEFGVAIPGTKTTKRWAKAIVFNVAAIPDNALDKIRRVVA